MASDLETENRNLRLQLRSYIEVARRNEEKLRRFNAFELDLIGASSFSNLLHLILDEMESVFSLDVVTLLLIDPEYECRRLVDASAQGPATRNALILTTDFSRLNTVFQDKPRSHLASFSEELYRPLFPEKHHTPCCVAVLPLIHQGKLIGSLNLGSMDTSRYGTGSGTEFLDRLATITAISIINSLNHERLKRVGLTDPLTQLNNRRFFDQRLQEEVAAAYRDKRPLACMFVDVDHFKQINDTYGHQAGDAVLVELSQRVQLQLRLSDTLSRYGGEEFVALLPGTGVDEARQIAERIRQQIALQPFSASEHSLAVTISLGIAVQTKISSGDTGQIAQELVTRADAALYLAKERGRNRIELN